MKAIVFIGGHESTYKQLEDRFKSVASSLGLDSIEYVIANVPAVIKKVVSEEEVGAIITYGCKPETEAIATEAGKIVIRYRIEDDDFSMVVTRDVGGNGCRIWNTEYVSWAETILC